jgi:hypothetical protein
VIPLLAAHEHFQDMGPWEWFTAVAAALVSAWAIWKSVRYALDPGETEPDHVKRSILDDDPPAQAAAAAAEPTPRRMP